MSRTLLPVHVSNRRHVRWCLSLLSHRNFCNSAAGITPSAPRLPVGPMQTCACVCACTLPGAPSRCTRAQGLGKTVEVLACLAAHPFPGPRTPAVLVRPCRPPSMLGPSGGVQP